MDLKLLDSKLAELGEPRYRAGQVWRWAARGAGDFAAMADHRAPGAGADPPPESGPPGTLADLES